MRRFEEIRQLLALKFSKEKKRLKTYGTKANSFDLANAVARFVVALMCESRYRELKRLKKVMDKQPSQGNTRKIWEHMKERLQATKGMTKVLQNFAEEMEKQRPYKPKIKKVKKEKRHGHHKNKHRHSH